MKKLDTNLLDITITQAYATTSHSSDEEQDKFYNGIETALRQYESSDNAIIRGEFNERVGRGSKQECGSIRAKTKK